MHEPFKSDNTVDLENFGVKKLCKAHTLTKLKLTRFFYYDNFTFKYLVHASSFHSTHLCKPNVCDNKGSNMRFFLLVYCTERTMALRKYFEG